VPTPIWGIELRCGKLVFDRPQEFSAYVHGLRQGRYDLTVKQHRDRRSTPQNRYLHGVVIPILAEHIGDDVVSVKEQLKWRFLRVEGKLGETVRHTSELDSAEMTDFIDNCRRLAAELGCSIPGPNEVE
jgi:hypothetical protein